jgi:hypothetical protein
MYELKYRYMYGYIEVMQYAPRPQVLSGSKASGDVWNKQGPSQFIYIRIYRIAGV